MSETVNAIGDKDAESVKVLIDALWTRYDKNGDGELEASECVTIEVSSQCERCRLANPLPLSGSSIS